nr:ABC transporter permease subunit [Balneatrix alpica]
MSLLLTLAGKEFRDGLRNRWFAAIAIMLALMAVGIAWVGGAASGQLGQAPLATTMVSLASLAVLVIPLIALVLGYDSLVGEAEQGTLLLLLTYPLQRWHILLGKLLGQGFIMAGATLLGFSGAALILVLSGGQEAWPLIRAFALFIAAAILLGWCFIALAYGISAGAQEKSKAAGLALGLWLLLVLVFDLALLAALVAAQDQLSAQLFPYLLLLNPTDIFRLFTLAQFAAGQPLDGVMALAQQLPYGLPTLLVAMLGWIVLPISWALWRFNRRPL